VYFQNWELERSITIRIETIKVLFLGIVILGKVKNNLSWKKKDGTAKTRPEIQKIGL
jgi:hypothetical protein